MARVKIDILGISELKWTRMGEFNSEDDHVYYCRQESLRRNGVALTVNKSLKCHIICLLRNLHAGQEATVITGHGKTDWFHIGKGVCQGYILSPCIFSLYGEYIMRNPDWMKHKLASRLLGEISLISDMQMTPPLWQKAKRN